MMKQLVKEYFSFTKKERVAVVALIALILIVYLVPQFFHSNVKLPSAQEIQEFRRLERQLAQPVKGREKDIVEDDDRLAIHTAVSTYEHSRPAQLFYFDPNTLDESGWRRLGLREKTIGTIIKYRSKGGRFYNAADLQKIYGLRPEEYQRIGSFVRIDDKKENSPGRGQYANSGEKYAAGKYASGAYASEKYSVKNKSGYAHNYNITGKHSRERVPIDINTADTAAFISLPGIGNKLAARIVFFRERLGGFYGIDQLAETYGLPDSTFQKIRPLLKISQTNTRKIDINSVSIEILKQHPYFKWNIAKAIVAYREQHGAFKNLEELLQVGVINEEAFRKLQPYILLGE